jgi:hypothetical protein
LKVGKYDKIAKKFGQIYSNYQNGIKFSRKFVPIVRVDKFVLIFWLFFRISQYCEIIKFRYFFTALYTVKLLKLVNIRVNAAETKIYNYDRILTNFTENILKFFFLLFIYKNWLKECRKNLLKKNWPKACQVYSTFLTPFIDSLNFKDNL